MKSSPEPLPDWVTAAHPARIVLNRYAGRCRWGVSYKFLDPSPEIAEWEERLGVTLIGIGEFQGGYIELYLASDGRYFGLDTVAGEISYYGDTLRQFHFARIFQKDRPLFRPDVESILWYGTPVMRDDPRVYAWFTGERHDPGAT